MLNGVKSEMIRNITCASRFSKSFNGQIWKDLKLNPKFDQLCEEEDGAQGKSKKLSSQEASHRLRIAQDAALVGIKAPKKMRELRWQSSMKDLQHIVTEKGE